MIARWAHVGASNWPLPLDCAMAAVVGDLKGMIIEFRRQDVQLNLYVNTGARLSSGLNWRLQGWIRFSINDLFLPVPDESIWSGSPPEAPPRFTQSTWPDHAAWLMGKACWNDCTRWLCVVGGFFCLTKSACNASRVNFGTSHSFEFGLFSTTVGLNPIPNLRWGSCFYQLGTREWEGTFAFCTRRHRLGGTCKVSFSGVFR